MPDQEEWRTVEGFPDYAVSNLGRVASYKRPERPIIMRTQIDRRGYYCVTFSVNDKTYTRSVHRLLLEAFRGPSEDGQLTRHLNGNPLDNRLENIVWGSTSENLLDAVRHGTHQMSRKTHCPQGHPYDQANTRWYRRMRYCIACQNARNEAARLARAGEVAA
jgi:hypothetical protein